MNECLQMTEFILYTPLSTNQTERDIDWGELAKRFGLKLIRERPSQATVEALPEVIDQVLETYPWLQATVRKKYHTLTPGIMKR
jgi:hypothetical protein